MESTNLLDESQMDSNKSLFYDTNSTYLDLPESLSPHTLLTEVLTNVSQLTPNNSYSPEGALGYGGPGGGLPLGVPEWCVIPEGNLSVMWDGCIPMQDPLEMRNPQHTNPSFVAIVVTHALTFLLGVSGNSIIVASMARDKGTRNVTRWVMGEKSENRKT